MWPYKTENKHKGEESEHFRIKPDTTSSIRIFQLDLFSQLFHLLCSLNELVIETNKKNEVPWAEDNIHMPPQQLGNRWSHLGKWTFFQDKQYPGPRIWLQISLTLEQHYFPFCMLLPHHMCILGGSMNGHLHNRLPVKAKKHWSSATKNIWESNQTSSFNPSKLWFACQNSSFAGSPVKTNCLCLNRFHEVPWV